MEGHKIPQIDSLADLARIGQIQQSFLALRCMLSYPENVLLKFFLILFKIFSAYCDLICFNGGLKRKCLIDNYKIYSVKIEKNR